MAASEFAVEFQTKDHDDLQCRVCGEQFEKDQLRETRYVGRHSTTDDEWLIHASHVHMPRCAELESQRKLDHVVHHIRVPGCDPESHATQCYAAIQQRHPLLFRAYHDFSADELYLNATWSQTELSDSEDVSEMPSFWLEMPLEMASCPLPQPLCSYSQFRSMFGQVVVMNVEINQINASNSLDTVKYWRETSERLHKIQSAEVLMWSHSVERIGETRQNLRVVMRVDLLTGSGLLGSMREVNKRDSSFCLGDVLQGGDMESDGQPLNQSNQSWMQSALVQTEIVDAAIYDVQQALIPPPSKKQEIQVGIKVLGKWRIAHTRVFENDVHSVLRYMMNTQLPNNRDEYYMVSSADKQLFLYEGEVHNAGFRGLPLVLDPLNASARDSEMQRLGLSRCNIESRELVLRLDTAAQRQLSVLRAKNAERRSRASRSFAS